MKSIVLIRHAQSEANKSDELRGITANGILQAKINTTKFAQYLGLTPDSTTVLSSSKHRALLTAEVICDQLNIDSTLILKEEMRIANLEKIDSLINSNELMGIRPAKTYLDFIVKQTKQTMVEIPAALVDRWDKIFDRVLTRNLVVVSHEASLEAYIYNQNRYRTLDKSFKRYFGYSDYCVLTSK